MTRLFIPGPTDVAEEVLAEQTRPIIGHRSDQFAQLFGSIQDRLRKVFKTQNRIYITASSGTGLWEGIVRNCVSSRLLVCVGGAFGVRWSQVAESNGIPHARASVEWGQPNTPDQVAEALSTGDYDTLAVVHSETSTGVQNPIAEIATAARQIQPDLLIMIDAVSSLGGIPLETDQWELDVVVASSQKCLALPPGLAFAAVSDRVLERARSIQHRGWYFDLLRMDESLQNNFTHTTPAVSLLFALDRQLDRILAEGLDQRFMRHAQMAEVAQSWAEEYFAPFAAEGYRSKTVTTMKNTREMDVAALNRFLAGSEYSIANGYAHLKDLTFRIGHMGETRPEDLSELLGKITEFIQ
jgi:predicted phosphoserine aminotransferase